MGGTRGRGKEGDDRGLLGGRTGSNVPRAVPEVPRVVPRGVRL